MVYNISKHSELIASCYEKTTQLETPYELFSMLRELATELGYANYAIVYLPEEGERNIRSAFLATNVPAELIAEYDSHKLLDTSPVMSALSVNRGPIDYDVDNIPQGRSEEQTALVTMLFKQYGIPRGVFFPCYDNVGRIGAVAFMGERPLPTLGERAILHLLSHFAFGHLHLLLKAADRSKSLSPREIECVELAALGKTNSECAMILGVSETTIAGHFASVARKLTASNKTHIVALAYEMGLIRPKGQKTKVRLRNSETNLEKAGK